MKAERETVDIETAREMREVVEKYELELKKKDIIIQDYQ